MYSQGLSKPAGVFVKDETKKNIYSFTCFTTQLESLNQKKTMLDYVIEFVYNLTKTRPRKEYDIMFLDGYLFILDMPLLIYLMENNMFPFIFASQVYVWLHFNDNKPNLEMNKCMDTVVTGLE